MVLDVKMMTWAGQNGIDTAKLKAAKVPIYGKWYFPLLPVGQRVVNLETGERQTFDAPMLAGELMWVAERDLRAAGLLPAAEGEALEPEAETGLALQAAETPLMEPLLAMARVPKDVAAHYDLAPPPLTLPATNITAIPAHTSVDHAFPPGTHMPKESIAPFILAMGITLALFGVIAGLPIFVIGLIWALVGAVAWVRIGVMHAEPAHTSAMAPANHT